MRFITAPAVQSEQNPQLVAMQSYPSWDRAPTYRVRLTDNASYYDDLDLYETDENEIQAYGANVNHGFLHEAGRLY